MFRHIFAPIFLIFKGIWRALVFLWDVFLRIISFVSSKIPGA